MATAARFGRLPRRAPNLTATIIAAAREYQAMRERNIQNAWQSGGDFEGKGATDDRLLKFFKDRMKGLDPSDPQANEYRNQITQYEFAIANSKMELKYARKDVNDNQMADFYREWGNKLPRNSEAWRQRMKLAAQYADRANATSTASNAAAEAKRYNDGQNKIYANKSATYDMLSGYMASIQRVGIMGQIAPVLNTDAESFEDIRVAEGDANNFLDIADYFNTSNDDWAVGERERVTRYINNHLDRMGSDFHFNGDFSTQNLMALNRSSIAGLTHQIKFARRHGRDTGPYETARSKAKGTQIALGGIDEKAQYEDARNDWLETVNDSSATVAQRLAATDAYSQTLLDLGKKALGEKNYTDAGKYNTEYLATQGETPNKADPNRTLSETSQTMWESSRRDSSSHPAESGQQAADPSQGGDAASTAASVVDMKAQFAQLAFRDPNSGLPLYAQVYVDSKGNPTADKTGVMRAVPIASIPNGAFTVSGPDSKGKKFGLPDGSAVSSSQVVTALMPEPVSVTTTTTDPTNHVQAVGQPTVLGNRYLMEDGTPVWSFVDGSGAAKYSLTNPWTGVPTRGADGWQITADAGNAAQAKRVDEAGGPSARDYTQPTLYDPNSNSRMPTSVFNSVLAAEMVNDPKGTYSKYTPETIRELAVSQSGGDMNKYTSIYNELDQQRAAYVKGGNVSWDEQLRLARANQNGDLPLMSDRIGLRGIGLGGAVGQSLAGTAAGSAESQALDRLVGGAKSIEEIGMRNIISAAVPGFLRGGLDFSATGQEQARAVAAQMDAQKRAAGTSGPTSIAQGSRNLANELISGIWNQVGGSTYGAGVPPGRFGAGAPRTVAPPGSYYIKPPVPVAPPPTAPPPVKPPKEQAGPAPSAPAPTAQGPAPVVPGGGPFRHKP